VRESEWERFGGLRCEALGLDGYWNEDDEVVGGMGGDYVPVFTRLSNSAGSSRELSPTTRAFLRFHYVALTLIDIDTWVLSGLRFLADVYFIPSHELGSE